MGVEKVEFNEILIFAIKNQAQQQGTDNFKSFKAQLWSIPQFILVNVLLDPEVSSQDRLKAFNLLSKTWIKEQTLSAKEQYGVPSTEKKTRQIIDTEGEKCKKFLLTVQKELSFLTTIGLSQIDQLQEEAYPFVHPMISTSFNDDNDTVEVEIQAETETETETEIEIEIDTYLGTNETKPNLGCLSGKIQSFDTVPESYLRNNNYILAIFPIADQFGREEYLSEFADLFEGINISFNILEFRKNEQDLETVNSLAPSVQPTITF